MLPALMRSDAKILSFFIARVYSCLASFKHDILLQLLLLLRRRCCCCILMTATFCYGMKLLRRRREEEKNKLITRRGLRYSIKILQKFVSHLLKTTITAAVATVFVGFGKRKMCKNNFP